MDRVHWLFLDLNSYFASVEQQERPELRGKPVGVVPMMADTTVLIAASYEAKAFGVKTGTRVGDAKRMCPGIQLVLARHSMYVRYHHKIVGIVDSCVPVDAVASVDEMVCRLTGSQQDIENAVALAQKIKRAIQLQAGECMKSSVGLAPSRPLATAIASCFFAGLAANLWELFHIGNFSLKDAPVLIAFGFIFRFFLWTLGAFFVHFVARAANGNAQFKTWWKAQLLINATFSIAGIATTFATAGLGISLYGIAWIIVATLAVSRIYQLNVGSAFMACGIGAFGTAPVWFLSYSAIAGFYKH